MDKERLERRRAKLEQERERMTANVHRLAGAIAMIDEILAEMASEPEPEPPTED